MTQATSRLLYFDHITSLTAHVGPVEDQWCTLLLARMVQARGALLQLDHQTGMKYFCNTLDIFCNLSPSWQPLEAFYPIHQGCQKYSAWTLMRVRKSFLGLIVSFSSSLIASVFLMKARRIWFIWTWCRLRLELKNILWTLYFVEWEHLFPFSSFEINIPNENQVFFTCKIHFWREHCYIVK